MLSQEILLEIEEERKKEALPVEEHPLVRGEPDDGIVLVACKDECSCMQLADCIKKGPQKVVLETFCPTFISCTNSSSS